MDKNRLRIYNKINKANNKIKKYEAKVVKHYLNTSTEDETSKFLFTLDFIDALEYFVALLLYLAIMTGVGFKFFELKEKHNWETSRLVFNSIMATVIILVAYYLLYILFIENIVKTFLEILKFPFIWKTKHTYHAESMYMHLIAAQEKRKIALLSIVREKEIDFLNSVRNELVLSDDFLTASKRNVKLLDKIFRFRLNNYILKEKYYYGNDAFDSPDRC